MLRIEPLHWDGHRHVALIGEIDLANVGDAEAVLELMAKRGLPLVLDCAGLTYCDSQAIAMMFRLAEQARDGGGSLTLANPRGIVRRVFEVTRVVDAVAVVDDAY
jgi:anti-sigma B factor antagonist